MKYYFSITHEDNEVLISVEAKNEDEAKSKFIKEIPNHIDMKYEEVEEVMNDYFDTNISSYGSKIIDI